MAMVTVNFHYVRLDKCWWRYHGLLIVLENGGSEQQCIDYCLFISNGMTDKILKGC